MQKKTNETKRIQDGPVEPVKIFDDVYYIGRRIVGIFVIKTSEGLVLIDSLDSDDAAEKYIIPGLEKLGLDPKEIKMILLTHGHFDHFAGARKLQELYHCHVALGMRDSAFMVTSEYPKDRVGELSYPCVDTILEDEKALRFGDNIIIPYLTPGHTPGGMSLIFNVHDKGKEHWASLWVGAGIPREAMYFDHDKNGREARMEAACSFVSSIHHFALKCMSFHCDVALGVHPHRCNLFEKIEQNANSEENAFIVGIESVVENLRSIADSAIDTIRQMLNDI